MLDALLAYVQENGRVCPRPMRWNEMYQLLPDSVRPASGGREPALPLILGAWNFASNLEKIIRLREHIEYASEKGVLAEVDKFLRALPEVEWHHLKE
jgi:hypothetical protein